MFFTNESSWTATFLIGTPSLTYHWHLALFFLSFSLLVLLFWFSMFLYKMIKGWFPYDRKRSQTIADRRRSQRDLFPYNRRRSQTIAEPTVAIHLVQRKCHMYSRCARGKTKANNMARWKFCCDRLRLRSQDRRRSQKCVSIWSQTIAELSAICDLRSAIVCDHMETSLKVNLSTHCNLGLITICSSCHDKTPCIFFWFEESQCTNVWKNCVFLDALDRCHDPTKHNYIIVA